MVGLDVVGVAAWERTIKCQGFFVAIYHTLGSAAWCNCIYERDTKGCDLDGFIDLFICGKA